MTSSDTPRFRVRTEDGSEIPVASVESLSRRVERGEVEPHTAVFDASTGVWSPAGESPVIRFIVEELLREGRLGDAGGWATPSDGASSDDPTTPTGGESGFTLVDPAPEPPPPSTAPPSPSEPQASERVEFSDWLTPSSAGGMAIPDPRPEVDPEPEMEPEPDPGSIPEPPPPISGGVGIFRLAFLLLLAAATVGVFFLSRQEWDVAELVGVMRTPVGTAVVAAELSDVVPVPPPHSELEGEVEVVLLEIRARFTAVTDSLRAEHGVSEVPPRPWLGGHYLANASEYPEVPAFWEGYLRVIETLRALDRRIYLETVREVAWVQAGDAADVERYFLDRYQAVHPPRLERYGYLEAAARNALDLHAFLLERESEIRYTPAMGEVVPLDPVLEAGSTDPEVQRHLTGRLDAVLGALDRSRMGGIPSPEGLRADLFLRFGEG